MAFSPLGSSGAFGSARRGDPVKIFFLLCVAVAGAFGAATASLRILWIQTVPALIALVAVIFT